jgi:hypothetical protein
MMAVTMRIVIPIAAYGMSDVDAMILDSITAILFRARPPTAPCLTCN